jgi:stringent starvation protein B
MVPVTHVLAIYAKETGQGMVLASPDDVPPVDPSPSPDTDAPAPPSGRPVLRRVK